MLPSERQSDIVRRVEETGYVKAAELQEAFGVSHMTIQRDLHDLDHRGLVRRVRGGAAALDTREIGYGSRERINRQEKEAIGRAAAALVESGQSVFVDAGTTALEVARHLAKRALSKLNLVTNSVKISAEVAGLPNLRVKQLGGDLYAQSFGVAGPDVAEALGKLNLDWAFLGTSGVDLQAGLTNGNASEVVVKKAAMASSRRTAFLADESKLGHRALVQIVAADDPHLLITTPALSPQDLKHWEALGWEVVIAT